MDLVWLQLSFWDLPITGFSGKTNWGADVILIASGSAGQNEPLSPKVHIAPMSLRLRNRAWRGVLGPKIFES